MRGSRAKALRAAAGRDPETGEHLRPNPGRKHGGVRKDATPDTDHRSIMATLRKKFLPKMKPAHPSQHTKKLVTTKPWKHDRKPWLRSAKRQAEKDGRR